jgi:hypothetical protein
MKDNHSVASVGPVVSKCIKTANVKIQEKEKTSYVTLEPRTSDRLKGLWSCQEVLPLFKDCICILSYSQEKSLNCLWPWPAASISLSSILIFSSCLYLWNTFLQILRLKMFVYSKCLWISCSSYPRPKSHVLCSPVIRDMYWLITEEGIE